MRKLSQHTGSVNSATDTLTAANARLRLLREQMAANGNSQLTCTADLQKRRSASDLVAVGTGILAQRRQLDGVGGTATDECVGERGSFLVIPTVAHSADPSPSPQPSSNTTPFLRMYPDLLLGMLRQEQVAIGRIWLLCRHLDSDGRGWLDVTFVREQLTRKTSPLRIIGQRRLRQILKDGAGIFWERDQLGRLWLYGTARVAAALGVERLTGRPIALSIADLITSLAHTRAHCYAAFHSGRRVDETADLANPISRETLAQLSGITGRTQRRYDALANVESHTCIAIGAPFDSAQHTETTWQHGNATFQLTDHLGKLGTVGKTYSAWQLPNQYRGCHTQLPRGRQHKLNKQLHSLATTDDDLVNLRARGNGLVTRRNRAETAKYVRVFFSNGRQATHDRNANGGYLLARATQRGGTWMLLA